MRLKASKLLASVQYRWMGSPEAVIFFGAGLGDDLLCGTVAHELKRRGAGRIAIFSRHPSLYENNPDVHSVYPWGYPTAGRLRYWQLKVYIPQYARYDPLTDRDITLNEPALVTMCRMAGVTGEITLRPYLPLLKKERDRGRLFDNQSVIQSAGLETMKNKNWSVERYQEVNDSLLGRTRVIQLGSATDPLLKGAYDLRGKTSIRETAAILANSKVFIGQAGFLMHLARSVDCRSVIVFGGREDPMVFGYSANENLVGSTPCTPCWQRTRCAHDHECMNQIDTGTVLEAASRQIELFGQPLSVDVAKI